MNRCDMCTEVCAVEYYSAFKKNNINDINDPDTF